MGKLDHIPELTDASAFFQWKVHVKLALGREGVYNHVSEGTDPLSFVDFAFVCPQPASPASPTEAERAAIMTWLQDDAVAKDILCRHLSLSVLRLVPVTDTTTTRDVWRLLHKRFDHVEVTSQHLLRARLGQLRMKDAYDASRYPGEHEATHRDLLRMVLSAGLTTFENISTEIAAEAYCLILDTSPSAAVRTASSPTIPSHINPVTGLCKTRNNPSGTYCDTPAGWPSMRASNHDRAHCFKPGGGMAGQRPPWRRGKEKEKDGTPAIKTPSSTPVSATATGVAAAALPPPP